MVPTSPDNRGWTVFYDQFFAHVSAGSNISCFLEQFISEVVRKRQRDQMF